MDKFKRVKKNKLNIVLEGLKHVQAKVWSKAKRNDKRIEQYRINRLFQQYQKGVYQRLCGKVESSDIPDTGESKRFWNNI